MKLTQADISVRRSRLHLNQPILQKNSSKSSAVKRSQLVEGKIFPAQDLFQNWLLRTGHSPQAGLPASQIGIYTDFQ